MAFSNVSPAPRRQSLFRFALLEAALGLAVFAADEAGARPGGGGGSGGGAASIGGGRGGFAGLGGGARPSGSRQRPKLGSGQRPMGQGAQRPASPGQGNRAAAANRNTGIAGNSTAANNGNRAGNSAIAKSGNGNGNTGVVNNGNVNNGNVAVGNDVDVNVANSSGWYGSGAAYATGVAVGATSTEVAVGSTYYSLPSSCATYVVGGYSYYSCGGAWYQQRYKGTSVTYVVVADPTKG